MRLLLILLVLTITVDAKPRVISCKVTEVKPDVVTLRCTDKRILDIPTDRWPEMWMGKRVVGSVFKKRGGLALPTQAWTLQQMTRERPDYERNQVN